MLGLDSFFFWFFLFGSFSCCSLHTSTAKRPGLSSFCLATGFYRHPRAEAFPRYLRVLEVDFQLAFRRPLLIPSCSQPERFDTTTLRHQTIRCMCMTHQ